MAVELSIACACRALTGIVQGVEADRMSRVVCGCLNCQAYAHILERADVILNPLGGIDVLPISPRYL